MRLEYARFFGVELLWGIRVSKELSSYRLAIPEDFIFLLDAIVYYNETPSPLLLIYGLIVISLPFDKLRLVIDYWIVYA